MELVFGGFAGGFGVLFGTLDVVGGGWRRRFGFGEGVGGGGCGAEAVERDSPAADMVLPPRAPVTAASIMSSAKRRVALSRCSMALRMAL